MENKKILMLAHHVINAKYNNPFYLNQIGNTANPDEVIVIDATSRNVDKRIPHDVSPFFVGPVVASDGKVAKCLENMWQFSKVFEGKANFRLQLGKKKYEDYEFVCSDSEGNPTEEWFKLREFGFNTTTAYRHPVLGKTLYQYFIEDGKVVRLNYLEARKKVYIPAYAKCVVQTETFKYLKSLVDSGKTIAILDFDAYNYYNKDYMAKRYERDKKKAKTKGYEFNYTVDDYLNINTLKDAINFPGLLAGHGFVLKLLLQGDIEVRDGEIIDHTGVLD